MLYLLAVLTVTASEKPPSLFLSCPQECFDTYLRQELSYFDFSRDPYLADFNIVVVRQPSGSNGERFTVSIDGSHSEAFSVPAGTADMVAREHLLQAILRILYDLLDDTPHAAAFKLSVPGRSGVQLSKLDDPWDYWAIAPELSVEGDGGSGYYFMEGTGAVTARRVTDAHKLRIRGSYTRRWSGFLLEDGQRVSGDVDRWQTRAIYAHTIREHWAAGAVVTGRADEYANLDGHLHVGALGEFNFFPYSENASKQLRLAYQIGGWANWYIERTAFGETREWKPYHALSLIADVNQPWGSMQWIGQINHFLDDPNLYRVSTGAILSLRITAGLAVNLEGEAALVRDQVNLRGRQITDTELLLWTAQQPTDYTFEIKLGISYTFGSTHNTIVNPRFARVDLDEE